MFLSILARRAARVWLCIKRSVIQGSALAFLYISAYSLYSYIFTDDSGLEWYDLFQHLTIAFIVGVTAFTLIKLANYKGKLYHLYDEDIIGDAFTGLKRSSMIFENGFELFRNEEFRAALEIFTDLQNDDKKLSQKEISVLDFYRGRCYDILGASPNALICYKKCRTNGFFIPELPIFTGRCLGRIGSTDKAEEIFKSYMRDDYIYHDRMRFEIGNMYLKANKCEEALKWFNESIEEHEAYADSLGGAAIACVMLGRCSEGKEFFRQSLINTVNYRKDFTKHFNELLNSAEQSDSKED